MSETKAKNAEKIVNEFLDRLGVDASAKVFLVEEYLKIEITGKDSSLLIGYHGENLRSLRHLLSSLIRKSLDERMVVSVDVSGYLEKKEERIKMMAQKAIDKFKNTKKPQHLPEMNAYERRIAHSYISEQGLSSESLGEGLERHIVIK